MKYYYSETMKAANVQFLLPPKSIPFVKKKKSMSNAWVVIEINHMTIEL